MPGKTWVPVHRAEYLRALKRTFVEIVHKVDELDSRFHLRDRRVRAEAMRIIKEAAGNEDKMREWAEERTELYIREEDTIRVEYGKAIEQLNKLGLKLAPPSGVKDVGYEGFFFQVKIGCMHAMAFLDDLLGVGEPKAKML